MAGAAVKKATETLVKATQEASAAAEEEEASMMTGPKVGCHIRMGGVTDLAAALTKPHIHMLFTLLALTESLATPERK